MDPKLTAALSAEIDASFDDEVAFLQALVRVPSDNPPGNCTPHSARSRTAKRTAPPRRNTPTKSSSRFESFAGIS